MCGPPRGRRPAWLTIKSSIQLFATTRGPSRDGFEELAHGEPAAWLAGGIFLKRLEELAHDLNGGHHGPQLFAPPSAIIQRLILVTFPRILTQVGDNRSLGRFHLAVEEVAFDGFEGDLPGVVTQSHEVGAHAEVEEFVARPGGDFALEEGHKVVAVEVVFERLV